MSDGNHPTSEQKHWLARVFGPQAWQELCGRPDFLDALNDSLGRARQIALRHLANKELNRGAG